MNITIIAVGKIKENYLNQGIEEYTKRLSSYAKLNIIEVKDEKAPESLSTKEQDQVKDKEGDKILAKIPSDSYVIALTIKGHAFSSEELANKIEDIKTYNSSHITFIIGGSLGLSNSVLRKTDLELSFSSFTFPHQLMRLILLEQLYRSFRINNNEPYHK
ncbi:23S rRNA (pseudouridine(1915)-N(3))-methyltransferase RlmH [Candidatus Xianfuyuplasma coldseepsis]|uniref:Ribosomal RNA large subunit methyltransferase H n=1 Tax=Candidatus Xianfuyuplasma coldseepsis TaxID=2782163 RepID=A0A7L7KPK6_9MOLU|nr:23S rRNA (pseudouridine(1915)-N(3))-methyltransferase RlmH [Xianfuyuplasma coldseepsis]QMS84720.1 23S rRNA (pseudouridine(1915)-N(3))-methyltransferase RlmH [Xianfuyuplasma coldseepsis]